LPFPAQNIVIAQEIELMFAGGREIEQGDMDPEHLLTTGLQERPELPPQPVKRFPAWRVGLKTNTH
jgi:hypothetical protein